MAQPITSPSPVEKSPATHQRSMPQFIRKVIDSIAKPLRRREGAKPKAAQSTKPKATK
jgi:hypothetical protein